MLNSIGPLDKIEQLRSNLKKHNQCARLHGTYGLTGLRGLGLQKLIKLNSFKL